MPQVDSRTPHSVVSAGLARAQNTDAAPVDPVTAPIVDCRRCNAKIRWLRTQNGKAMPVDADPNPAGNVILVDGYAHVLHKDEPVPPDVARLYPHFATCGK